MDAPEKMESLHVPVLLEACLDKLNINPNGRYVDMTFGAGGHSRAILAKLSAQGRLLGLDRDSKAQQYAETIKDPRFYFRHTAFAELQTALNELNWDCVDGFLMDLGVSSMQLEQGDRGFSFQKEGELDMRMDTRKGESAAQWLMRANEGEIAQVLLTLGEERMHRRIARTIVSTREKVPITTTRQLANLVYNIMPAKKHWGNTLPREHFKRSDCISMPNYHSWRQHCHNAKLFLRKVDVCA